MKLFYKIFKKWMIFDNKENFHFQPDFLLKIIRNILFESVLVNHQEVQNKAKNILNTKIIIIILFLLCSFNRYS